MINKNIIRLKVHILITLGNYYRFDNAKIKSAKNDNDDDEKPHIFIHLFRNICFDKVTCLIFHQDSHILCQRKRRQERCEWLLSRESARSRIRLAHRTDARTRPKSMEVAEVGSSLAQRISQG